MIFHITMGMGPVQQLARQLLLLLRRERADYAWIALMVPAPFAPGPRLPVINGLPLLVTLLRRFVAMLVVKAWDSRRLLPPFTSARRDNIQ
jgi:hypothetical protein